MGKPRKSEPILESDGETQLIYKRSNTTFLTHSRTSSNRSRSDLLQLKKKLSQHKEFYTDGGKVKRDLSIETDICILRRYFRHRRHRMSTREAKSAKSRYSNYTEIGTIEELNHDESASGDNLKNYIFNVDVTSLMVNNFKTLLNSYMQQHVKEDQDKKEIIQDAFDAVLNKMQAQKPNLQPSSSNTTFVLERSVVPEKRSEKNFTSLDGVRSYCFNKSSTISISAKSDHWSWYSIPTFCKKLKILSTLSIPRRCKNSTRGIRKKPKKLKVSRGNHKNIMISFNNVNKMFASGSSMDLLQVSTRSLLGKYVNYCEAQVYLSNQEQYIKGPVMFLPEPSLMSASVSTNILDTTSKNAAIEEASAINKNIEKILEYTEPQKCNVDSYQLLHKQVIDGLRKNETVDCVRKINSESKKFGNNIVANFIKTETNNINKSKTYNRKTIEPKNKTKFNEHNKMFLPCKQTTHCSSRNMKDDDRCELANSTKTTAPIEYRSIRLDNVVKNDYEFAPLETATRNNSKTHIFSRNFTRLSKREALANLTKTDKKNYSECVIGEIEYKINIRNAKNLYEGKQGQASYVERTNRRYLNKTIYPKDPEGSTMRLKNNYIDSESFVIKSSNDKNHRKYHSVNHCTMTEPVCLTKSAHRDKLISNITFHTETECRATDRVKMNKSITVYEKNSSKTPINQDTSKNNIWNSFNAVNQSLFGNKLEKESILNKKNTTFRRAKKVTLFKRIAKRRKLVFDKHVPKFEDIRHKDFTFLYKKSKGNFNKNECLKHFLDIFQYFVNFDNNRNLTLDVHVNVFPLFESGSDINTSQTSKNLDPREVRTSPTVIFHVTPKGRFKTNTKENRKRPPRRSASHCLGFAPEIIPLLDTTISQAKYIVNNEQSVATYKSNIDTKSYVTDRATNTVETTTVIHEIGQLKATVKELAQTTQRLIVDHSRHKKKTDVQDNIVSNELNLVCKQTIDDAGVILKTGVVNRKNTEKMSRDRDDIESVIEMGSKLDNKQTQSKVEKHCEYFIQKECSEKRKPLNIKVCNKKITLAESGDVSQNENQLNQNKIGNQLKSNIPMKNYNPTKLNKWTKRKEAKSKDFNINSFARASNSLKQQAKKEQDQKRRYKSQGIQISSRFNHIPSSTLKAGPKQHFNYKSENKVPERNTSFNTIESESVLKVTNMMSSINACYSPKKSRVDQALTVSLPLARSLYEISTTSTIAKPKVLTYYCDATMPPVLGNGENKEYDYITPCPSATKSKHKKSFQLKRPGECKECGRKDNESCETLRLDPMNPPKAIVFKCGDCNKEFSYSSIQLETPPLERRKMGKAEGVFYCFMLWIPIFLLMIAFYHLIILKSKDQGELHTTLHGMTELKPVSQKNEFIKLSDLGF